MRHAPPSRFARFVACAGLLPILAGCPPSGPPPPARLGPGPDTVRILSYNIHHGEGMDSILDLGRVADLIRAVDPDLVALQEVDSMTTRTDRVDQAAELGRLTGMTAVFGRFMAYRGGAYGMAVLSRWPVTGARNVRLPDGAEPRSALALTVHTPTGRRLRFVGVHLYRSAEERLAQARRLDPALGEADLPTVLAGDFNSTPGSPVIEELEASWTRLAKGSDRLTFPSYAPEREIDFVFLRPKERFEPLEHRLLDEPVASDHRPLLAEVVLRPGARPSADTTALF